MKPVTGFRQSRFNTSRDGYDNPCTDCLQKKKDLTTDLKLLWVVIDTIRCQIKKKNRLTKRNVFKLASRRYAREGIILTPQQLWSLAKKQKCRCALSGRRLQRKKISIDHIIHRSKGGSHDLSNIRLVETDVNKARSTLSDSEFFQLCKDVLHHNNILLLK